MLVGKEISSSDVEGQREIPGTLPTPSHPRLVMACLVFEDLKSLPHLDLPHLDLPLHESHSPAGN